MPIKPVAGQLITCCFGGPEPKHAWASLRLFDIEVLPDIEVAEDETTDLPL